MIRSVVFPVAGLGTRFLPASKAIPKEMLTVVDKPLIQHAVEEAKSCGIERFIFVTSYGKTPIEDHFDHNPYLVKTLEEKKHFDALAILEEITFKPGQAVFIRQQKPKGLGHAIGCAAEIVGNEPFAVILPDDLVLSSKTCLQQMLAWHDTFPHANLAAVEEVPMEQVSSYGILEPDMWENNDLVKVKTLQEKPQKETAKSNLAIIGRYILQPSIFKQLDHQQPGAKGEIQLTDAMDALIPSVPFYGYKFEGKRFDCGHKRGWLEANLAFALKDPESRAFIIEALNHYKQYYSS